MIELLEQPWPWYVAGPLIGLTVPILLIIGNKAFGISSSLSHLCAACFPSNIPFFKYDWKKEAWNLFFVTGILIGGFLAVTLIPTETPISLSPGLSEDLKTYGISTSNRFVPAEIVSWHSLFTLKGFLFIVAGGFMVGFGTRYAGGCTSGHSIMGLSTLQWPSLVATICFMIGGFFVANLVLPLVLNP